MSHILSLHTNFVNLVNQAQTTPPAPSGENASLAGWAIGFIIAAGVLALVARPLLLAENVPAKKKVAQDLVQEQARLEALYERVAVERKSLEELEFDQELGNLSETDYTSLKQKTENSLTALTDQLKAHEATLSEVERKLPAAKPAIKATPKPKTVTAPDAPRKSVAAVTTNPPTRTNRQAELESRLKPAVREVMKCDECATAFKPGDKFCSKCGAPLPHICLNCGTVLKNDMRFCAKCGAAVND